MMKRLVSPSYSAWLYFLLLCFSSQVVRDNNDKMRSVAGRACIVTVCTPRNDLEQTTAQEKEKRRYSHTILPYVSWGISMSVSKMIQLVLLLCQII